MSVSAASLARVRLKVIPTVAAEKATAADAVAAVNTSKYMTPASTKLEIFAFVGAAFSAWFITLPTDPSALSSGDFWNNGGTLAQVP